MKIVCVAVMAAAVLVMTTMMGNVPKAQASTITCSSVTSYVSPCLFDLSQGGKLPISTACCTGVRNLNNAAKTTPDRKAACTCLKDLARRLSGIPISVAAGIPGKCGVPVPYKIDPNTDCTKVR